MSTEALRATRRWLTAAGGGLLLAAIVLVAVSRVDGSLIEFLRWPGDDVLVVVGFFTVAVCVGAVLVTGSLVVEPSDSPTHEPEAPPQIPRAGAEFDRLDTNPLWARPLSEDERRARRARLRRATVQTIRRVSDVSRREAEARVERGTWTENATAAAFLGAAPRPRSARLYARVSDRLAARHGARETARALVAYEAEGAER